MFDVALLMFDVSIDHQVTLERLVEMLKVNIAAKANEVTTTARGTNKRKHKKK
jgi:hypothetical protein